MPPGKRESAASSTSASPTPTRSRTSPTSGGRDSSKNALRDSGISHAILRPTVLYSAEDILLNNIAWTLRRFPVVLLPGRGEYGIQPVFVEDLAALAVKVMNQEENLEIDAVGPEIYSYAMLVKTVRSNIGAQAAVLPAPQGITYLAGRALGMILGDIVLTRDELKGLSRGLLVSRSNEPAPCPTRLSEWLRDHGNHLGRHYANEVKRHYQ